MFTNRFTFTFLCIFAYSHVEVKLLSPLMLRSILRNNLMMYDMSKEDINENLL